MSRCLRSRLPLTITPVLVLVSFPQEGAKGAGALDPAAEAANPEETALRRGAEAIASAHSPLAPCPTLAIATRTPGQSSDRVELFRPHFAL